MGAIVTGLLGFIIGNHHNKIEYIKAQSEFSRQLYSARLKAYTEIYELVSGFIKNIYRNEYISYAELNDFYKMYSLLDSKSGLLFSYTTRSSANLMQEIGKILKNHSNEEADNIFFYDLEDKLRRNLVNVENSMKYELGVYIFKNPIAIMRKLELTKTGTETLDKVYAKSE